MVEFVAVVLKGKVEVFCMKVDAEDVRQCFAVDAFQLQRSNFSESTNKSGYSNQELKWNLK